MKADWVIIGGGIHGVHLAARLIGDADIAPEQLRIIDPGERLLERWRAFTETTGMTHLRSPSVHLLPDRAEATRLHVEHAPRETRGTIC